MDHLPNRRELMVALGAGLLAALPAEQSADFEFVVNLKTAKALGITIPPAVLLQADQVIE